MMRRVVLVLAFSSSALAAAGCDQEQLRVLKPRIDLCPTADAPAAECGDTIDLGRVVAGVPFEAQVFIVNRGDGALGVTGATVDIDVDTIALGAAPERVSAGGAEPLPVTITLAAGALGPGSATMTVTSNDETTPSATVTLAWEGIEPPRGDVLLCDAALAEPICASEIDVDFGAVRPTQTTSRLIIVTNGGETDLFIEDLRIDPLDADFALASSSQPVVLAPGEQGSIVVVFTGNAEGVRQANLVVISDDPDTPNAVARLSGLVGDNLPPTAVAFESVSGETTATATVSQVVGVDGTASTDPEGDPLAFTWTLEAPAGSAAIIEDASAQNALFVPDVRGTYTITLVVSDSIEQASAPVSVTIDVGAELKARARVTWASGGDVDVHLVQGGGALFSAVDARYDNRVVGDAELLDDATAAPGLEEAVLTPPVPGAGTWEVWAHVFDDAGLGPVDVTVSVIVDDEAPAALELTQTLNATCAAWHAADLVVDGAGNVTVTAVDAPVVTICP